MRHVVSNKIVGHVIQLQLLQNFIHKQKMHHGLLFVGPKNVGKMTIARAFAHKIITGDCVEKWDVMQKNDTDTMIIQPLQEEKKGKIICKDIGIEQILIARKTFALAADECAKFMIIDDADRMTVSAQNALLKTLEEPSRNGFIILVAHREDQLLDTIRSRCFTVHFNMVFPDDMKKICDDEQLIEDAQGRPGYLFRMQNDDVFHESVKYARDQLRALYKMSIYERMKLAQMLSSKDSDYIHTFFSVWIYRIWKTAHKTQKLHLLRVADKIEHTLRVMYKTNVNKQMILEDLLIHIV